MNPKELANAIAAAAADKKAKDILLLNMVGLSPVTDYFMICSAQSSDSSPSHRRQHRR